jgi:hypothetical protein
MSLLDVFEALKRPKVIWALGEGSVGVEQQFFSRSLFAR